MAPQAYRAFVPLRLFVVLSTSGLAVQDPTSTNNGLIEAASRHLVRSDIAKSMSKSVPKSMSRYQIQKQRRNMQMVSEARVNSSTTADFRHNLVLPVLHPESEAEEYGFTHRTSVSCNYWRFLLHSSLIPYL